MTGLTPHRHNQQTEAALLKTLNLRTVIWKNIGNVNYPTLLALDAALDPIVSALSPEPTGNVGVTATATPVGAHRRQAFDALGETVAAWSLLFRSNSCSWTHSRVVSSDTHQKYDKSSFAIRNEDGLQWLASDDRRRTVAVMIVVPAICHERI